MGDKIVKSKNLCCQPVVFPSLSLLRRYILISILNNDELKHFSKVLKVSLKLVKESFIVIPSNNSDSYQIWATIETKIDVPCFSFFYTRRW